jgi:hypothetical protein
MKKSIGTVLLFVIIVSCQKQVSKTNLHLTGNVKGLKYGTLYIQRRIESNLIPIDTIKIDGDSQFETDIELPSAEMLYLFLDRGVTNSLDNNILFFAEPGAINIDTNLDAYIFGAKITGSKNQEKYEEYQKINRHFKDENLDLIEKRFNALKNGAQKSVDSIAIQQDNNTRRKYLFAANFALNNSSYEVSPYIALSDIYDIKKTFLDTIQKKMSPKVAQSLYGKKLTKYVANLK